MTADPFDRWFAADIDESALAASRAAAGAVAGRSHGVRPARTFAEQACEYRLDIMTSPEPDDPAAVLWFRARSVTEAIAQSRAHLAAHPGPDDRYGELHRRDGDLAGLIDTIHLGA